jgi:hypothetical protein
MKSAARWALLGLVIFFVAPSYAQTSQEIPEDPLDEVVVSVARPGPKLWRVAKGDHEMWVLGTVSPVPRKMQWDASIVEGVIAEAGAVLLVPSAKITFNTGFFGGLMLLPSALGARNNPDKQKLKDVIPAADYARWLVQKKKYLRGNGIERRRPILAAAKLYEKALRRVGLQRDNVTMKLIMRAAKKRRLKPITPTTEFKINDPKQLLAEVKTESINDRLCFTETLSFVERDLPSVKARALAWADGDISKMRSLPLTDFRSACTDAFLQSAAMKRRNVGGIVQQIEDSWMKAAEQVLADQKVSFAVLPMSQLLEADGYLAKLAAKGYVVEAPDGAEQSADIAAPALETK